MYNKMSAHNSKMYTELVKLRKENEDLSRKKMESDKEREVYKKQLAELAPRIMKMEEALSTILNVKVEDLKNIVASMENVDFLHLKGEKDSLRNGDDENVVLLSKKGGRNWDCSKPQNNVTDQDSNIGLKQLEGCSGILQSPVISDSERRTIFGITEGLSIPELIKLIKHSYREREYNEFERILMDREEKTKIEIENLVRDREELRVLVDKTQGLAGLEIFKTKDKMQRSCKKLEATIRTLNEEKRVSTDRQLKIESLRREKSAAEETVVELRRQNDELRRKEKLESDKECEVCKSQKSAPRIGKTEEMLSRIFNVEVEDLKNFLEENVGDVMDKDVAFVDLKGKMGILQNGDDDEDVVVLSLTYGVQSKKDSSSKKTANAKHQSVRDAITPVGVEDKWKYPYNKCSLSTKVYFSDKFLEKLSFEECETLGTIPVKLGDVDSVRLKLPKKLKMKRHIETEDGSTAYEEYIDYLSPEETTQTTKPRNLESEYKSKKQKI